MSSRTMRRVFPASKWASPATRRIEADLREHFGPDAQLWRAWKCQPVHPWEVRIGESSYPMASGSDVKDWIVDERRRRAAAT